jgi:glycosyltransferase involved in cell wall biosynthesis
LFIASGNAINYNGIRYFLDNVFNVLTERYCDVNLIIAGTICEKLSNEHSKQIQLIGKIEDLSDFYKLGDIVINPIYQGTGLKVKTFEALSYGKIVVAHRHSTEGVYEEITAPIMIADSPSSYLSHLIKLLDSPENWQQYSDNSIDYINRLNKYVKDQYKNIFSK